MTTSAARPDSPAARVLWFYGTDAVGKSTVGWEAYSALSQRAVRVAYVDTDYLSFCHPAPSQPAELVAANLRAVWSVYRAAGIDHLVISGIVVTPDDRDRFCRAVPGARFTFCRLTAAPAAIRRRIFARREAEARTQDKQLTPEVRAELDDYSRRSVDFAAALERVALADVVLGTDDSTPAQLAAQALARFHPEHDLESR